MWLHDITWKAWNNKARLICFSKQRKYRYIKSPLNSHNGACHYQNCFCQLRQLPQCNCESVTMKTTEVTKLQHFTDTCCSEKKFVADMFGVHSALKRSDLLHFARCEQHETGQGSGKCSTFPVKVLFLFLSN